MPFAVESVRGGHPLGRCPPASGRDLWIAPARGECTLILGETSLDPRIDTGIAFGVTGRCLLTTTDHVVTMRVPLLTGSSRSHDLPRRPRDRSRSRGRSPPSSDHSWSKERGRRARREQQEGVETVTVSQAPAVSEARAVATPAAGGATLAALPSAVQDLARFFLSLSGSASLGVAGGVAGVAAPASGVGVPLCPSTSGGGAVTFGAATAIPAGAGGPPFAFAAVPGVSGRQQRQETSRPNRRHCRSSSDGTDRRSKKRPRGRSPFPGPSSRHWERSYRSDSESSEDGRAKTFPPRAGRAPGGTPGNFRPASVGDCSPRPGPSGWTSRSSARAEHHRSGADCRYHSPSGGADDDPSSAVDTVDFDRDDSFRSVLGLIRNFHTLEEPAGIPSAWCKTSLASFYGLMSETSPAFHLPVSPLVQSLLDDSNLALSKFLEDQTVHGFARSPS